MRTIYLDIDGVLATNATYRAVNKRYGHLAKATVEIYAELIDPSKMAMLNAFGEDVGASVVLSSTWRVPGVIHTGVMPVLKHAGLRLPIVGITDYSGWPMAPRGLEINRHIVANNLKLEDIVVFDDDPEAARSRGCTIRHGARVVLTPASTGLNPKLIARAYRLFGYSK